ncbi:hypothetical protein [uncultured Winogradskyella sp.]|nr:hypothetical protein [uncultured Winogradskyella sp.]
MNPFQKLRLQWLKPHSKPIQKEGNDDVSAIKQNEAKRAFKDEDVFLFI